MALKKVRKVLILPSTAGDSEPTTVEIRRLSGWEMAERGIPDPIKAMAQAAKAKGEPPEASSLANLDAKSLRYSIETALSAIIRHPSEGKLVYKAPEDCAEGEFSWHDLDPQDQTFLVAEVFKLIGEGAAEAASFPEAQG